MKKVYWSIVCGMIALVAFGAVAQQGATPPADKPAMSDSAKIGYSLGAQIGKSLKSRGLEIDVEAFIKGLKDAVADVPLALTEDEMRQAQRDFQKNAMAKQQEQMKKQGEEQEAYLKENSAKAGVVTLPSGLQYRVITAGSGPKPVATDNVKVNYRGTFMDGTEFDSSFKRNEPTTFPVGGVIPGWSEAIQLMPVGSKWELVIPANIAYGAQGDHRGGIPPNKMLIFEVELLEIVAAPPAAPMGQVPSAPSAPGTPGKVIVETAPTQPAPAPSAAPSAPR